STNGQVGVADRQIRRPGLHPLCADAICDPPAPARGHMDHPDLAGHCAWKLYPLVQFLGAAPGLAGTVAGTMMAGPSIARRPIRCRSADTPSRVMRCFIRSFSTWLWSLY